MLSSMRTFLVNLKQRLVSGGREGTQGRTGQGKALGRGQKARPEQG